MEYFLNDDLEIGWHRGLRLSALVEETEEQVESSRGDEREVWTWNEWMARKWYRLGMALVGRQKWRVWLSFSLARANWRLEGEPRRFALTGWYGARGMELEAWWPMPM